jgi:hypothetical protein
LPLVPITDLVVKDADLVAATQGRAFWILDDVSPLRQMTPEASAANAWLFEPAPATLYGGSAGGGRNAGANPPPGALIYYRLEREPSEKEAVTLEFLDQAGKLVRKISSKPEEADDDAAAGGGEDEGGPGRGAARTIPAKAGLNRFAWDLRYADASRFKGLILWGGGLQGPRVAPGTYQVRLTAFGKSQTRRFEVRKDPRLQTTPEELQKRLALGLAIRDKLTETHDAIVRLRDVRDQVKAVAERAKTVAPDSSIASAARALSERLTSIEEALYQTKNKSSQDPLNYPIRLNNKLSNLAGVVASADAPPTDQSQAVYQDLAGKIDAQLARLAELLRSDLASFNRIVREKEIPAVVVRPKKERGGTETVPSPDEK